MSHFLLSHNIADPENTTSNEFMMLANQFNSIYGDHFQEGSRSANASLEYILDEQTTPPKSYSEVLEQLASSLDSPTNYSEVTAYVQNYNYLESEDLKYKTCFSSSLCYDQRKSLMSASNDTLYENPNDGSKELISGTPNDFLHNYGFQMIKTEISEQSLKVKYFCPVLGCNKEFTRKANRRAHMEIHKPNRPRPFVCMKCPKAYLRSIDLVRHIETSHEKAQRHLCTECGRLFTRKEGLKKHSEKGNCSSFQC